MAASDLQEAPLAWLLDQTRQGAPGALVTIVGVEGGAPRPLGTQMAVLADGRFQGQISGGCVEPAIAAEVQSVIAGGEDAILRIGRGSRAIDIQFPCGGGVDVLVHVAPEPAILRQALALMAERRTFALVQHPGGSRTEIVAEPDVATGWRGQAFARRFAPRTRALLIGRGQELEATARTALAAGLDLHVASPSAETLAALALTGVPVTALTSPAQTWPPPIDRWTATVLLFHDHDWELPILENVLAADGFYIGALGSHRTHRKRCEHLLARGVAAAEIDRIKGPVGLITPARDPGTLAISILAEIAQERALLPAL
ncbi:XdhC family protein [Pelagibacterium sediminicola]|uniref:XdhC family protein n=1 Tax=Pelagibacterium sediminicola TaxID=2248761 RepID=UPI001FEB2455|nr:XdhC family protein [Pelagibacterium sediminicola]